MSVAGSDLGVLEDLAKALGLLDSGGGFNGDWMSAPGDHLQKVLADDSQRAGLISFVDEVLGGPERVSDPSGLVWLPVFERSEGGEPAVTVYVVLDEHPSDHVRIGIGVTVEAADGIASVKAHVPMFRAAKLDHAGVSNPVVLGTADGVIGLDVEIAIADPTIQSVALTALVPTGSTAAPVFGLALRGLRLPGAPAPSDLVLSISDLDDLEQAFTELVLGLVKAQVDALDSGPLAALAGLVGLRGSSAVPDLPVHDILEHGLPALTAWFEDVIRGDATRAVWLAELADLLGGAVDGDSVAFALGPARLRVGARAGNGTGGHPTVTPFVAVEIGPPGGNTVASASADLAIVDLGSGTATALPSCAIAAVIGRRTRRRRHAAPGGRSCDRPLRRRVRAGRGPEAHASPRRRARDDRGPRPRGRRPLDTGSHRRGGRHRRQRRRRQSASPSSARSATRAGAARPRPPRGFRQFPTIDPRTFLQDPLGAVGQVTGTRSSPSTPTRFRRCSSFVRDLVADASQGRRAQVAAPAPEADPWRVTNRRPRRVARLVQRVTC